MELIIAEEFLVISREPDGRPRSRPVGEARTVAGAMLVDLALAGLVGVAGDRLVARGPGAAQLHPELAGMLRHVHAEQPRKPKWWVQNFEARPVQQRLLAGLAARGVVAGQQWRRLGLFPVTRWVEQDPRPRQEIMQRLDAALAGGDADGRTCALAALVHACQLSGKVFPYASNSLLRKRMRELSEGNWAAEAVRDAVRAVQAAAAGAIVTAAAGASGG